mmetsp:Transcript_102872/g.330051  ORF Transcript_102872/g.330051 Transcript_102872/m.330051 type:complete len:204 (-) Transcript_102872:710-1321(-)
MSEIMPLTLSKTPAPEAPWRIAEAMRLASSASAASPCALARPRTRRTASKVERSARVESFMPVCAKETWLKELSPVASLMISLALAMAASSSPRLLVSDSKSSALVMQSWWRVCLASMSVANSLEVTSRSPSAVDFFSELTAISIFAASMSLFANLISSFRLCSNIWKLCIAVVSFLRESSNCPSALSVRPCKVSKRSPLLLS